MPWDGIRKRSSDSGKEPPEVILARVDENIKFLKAGAEAVRIQLNEHEKDDNKKFHDLTNKQDKTNAVVIWASGGLAVAIFFINLLFKH